MYPERPRWIFICSPARDWTWRSVDAFAETRFPSLGDATENAATHGFDSFSQYWTATENGRTTHFRPGRTSINLPAGDEPPV
jgi:hypothetical protein